MKLAITFFLILGSAFCNAQNESLIRVKISNDRSSLQVLGTDTSYMYNALVINTGGGSISSVTLTCKAYNATGQYTVVKDTSYNWNAITTTQYVNAHYSASKPNSKTLKLCLGRLSYVTRHKYTFNINTSNGILTREFDF